MGRFIFTENGKQMFRNFKWIRVIWPDGRMSRPIEFQGSIVINTGHEPETDRVLEFLVERTPQQQPYLRYAAAFILGLAVEAFSRGF